jgi:hypothetical protein
VQQRRLHRALGVVLLLVAFLGLPGPDDSPVVIALHVHAPLLAAAREGTVMICGVLSVVVRHRDVSVVRAGFGLVGWLWWGFKW